MNSADASVIDLLLTNLPEHRVVRLQGTLQWCESVRQRLSATAGYSLVAVEGQVGLADLQPILHRSSSANRLIWLDPESIDRDACIHLAELMKNTPDGQLRIVLVSSPELNSVLDSLPRDSALLVDGIYQQELEIGRSTGQSKLPLWLGAGLFLVLVGGVAWYLLQPSVPATKAGLVTPQPAVMSSAKPDSTAKQKEPVTLVEKSTQTSPSVITKSAKVETVEMASKPAQSDLSSSLAEQEPEIAESSAAEARRSVIDLYESVLFSSAAKPNDLSEKQSDDGQSDQKPTDIAVAEKLSEVAEPADKTMELPHQPALTADSSEENSTTVNSPEVISSGNVVPSESPSIQTHVDDEKIISDYSIKPAAVALPAKELERIMATVNQWASGWSEQNWERYIDSYITKPHGIPMPLAEWRAFRKQRLLEPEWVKLTFGKPTLTVHDSHWVKVELYQRFEKPGYADETTKRLAIQKTAEGWKIASEATDGTVVLSR